MSETAKRNLNLLLVVTGFIGALAACFLIVERMNLLSDPNYVPMCAIGESFDCGSVMSTEQAKVFGFPNAIMGIVGFSIVMTIGVAGLAGATFKNWFWGGLQIGVTFAVMFIHWLMYQTLYEIHSLCLYCMIVWAVTAPLFWYVTLRNLGAFDDSEEVEPGLLTDTVVSRFHWAVPIVWYAIVASLVANKFWL